MRIKMVLFLALVLVAGLALSSPARAADFELTPFAGYTGGGAFTDEVTGATLNVDESNNYGVMFDIKQTDETEIELYYSKQATRLTTKSNTFVSTPLFDLDISYFHIGGTYGVAQGKVKPFVVGGLGVTYMSPHGYEYDSMTRFSLSLGGGAKLYITDHIGLRLEGRWLGTLFNGSGNAFCVNGVCAIQVQGDMFSQFSANAGLIVAF